MLSWQTAATDRQIDALVYELLYSGMVCGLGEEDIRIAEDAY